MLNMGNIQRNMIQLSINIRYHIDIYLNLVLDTHLSDFIFLRAIIMNAKGLSIYNSAYILNSSHNSS